MKLISRTAQSYRVFFGFSAIELPKGFYGVGGMVHSLPSIMVEYTKIIVPVNVKNVPNKR